LLRGSNGDAAPTTLTVRVSRGGRLLAGAVAVGACALSLVRFGLGFEGFTACFFSVVLVALSTIDLDRQLLPNRILLPAIAILAAAELVHDPAEGIRRLAWAAGAFAVMLGLALVYPAGLGMGDVKLAAFLGLGLGRSVVAGVLLGCLAAAIVGIGVLARYGRAGRKVAVPLGPFLALGSLAALFTIGPR
jgi:leader peptidase (prepilin peptidase)/N-methyltransferase